MPANTVKLEPIPEKRPSATATAMAESKTVQMTIAQLEALESKSKKGLNFKQLDADAKEHTRLIKTLADDAGRNSTTHSSTYFLFKTPPITREEEDILRSAANAQTRRRTDKIKFSFAFPIQTQTWSRLDDIKKHAGETMTRYHLEAMDDYEKLALRRMGVKSIPPVDEKALRAAALQTYVKETVKIERNIRQRSAEMLFRRFDAKKEMDLIQFRLNQAKRAPKPTPPKYNPSRLYKAAVAPSPRTIRVESFTAKVARLTVK